MLASDFYHFSFHKLLYTLTSRPCCSYSGSLFRNDWVLFQNSVRLFRNNVLFLDCDETERKGFWLSEQKWIMSLSLGVLLWRLIRFVSTAGGVSGWWTTEDSLRRDRVMFSSYVRADGTGRRRMGGPGLQGGWWTMDYFMWDILEGCSVHCEIGVSFGLKSVKTFSVFVLSYHSWETIHNFGTNEQNFGTKTNHFGTSSPNKNGMADLSKCIGIKYQTSPVFQQKC